MAIQARISELKNRLSHYLDRVRGGEPVIVLDRNQVIARIEPAGAQSESAGAEAMWLDDLERRGVVRRASTNLPRTWLTQRPNVGDADVVAALLDERRDER